MSDEELDKLSTDEAKAYIVSEGVAQWDKVYPTTGRERIECTASLLANVIFLFSLQPETFRQLIRDCYRDQCDEQGRGMRDSALVILQAALEARPVFIKALENELPLTAKAFPQ